MKGKVFTAQEVQAIISGNKTQFREVIKPYPVLSDDKSYWKFKGVRWAGEKSSYAKNFGNNARPEMPDLCPYQVGQKIFCKESFQNWDDGIVYKANNSKWDKLYESEPAQHMKQEHSRLTLQIKEIRVEKLSEISEEDAIAEGNYLDRCACLPRKKDKSPIDAMFKQNWCHIHGQEFKDAWNSTHKKPEDKFEANPWVWCVNFEVVKLG